MLHDSDSVAFEVTREAFDLPCVLTYTA